MEKAIKWLVASPLGRVLAHRLVVAALAAILGALGAAGLEFAPGLVRCLEDGHSVSVSNSLGFPPLRLSSGRE